MIKVNDAETIKIRYADETVNEVSVIPNGDWIDLRSAETVELKQGEFRIISLGVSMKLPDGYEAHVVPRSSTFKIMELSRPIQWALLIIHIVEIMIFGSSLHLR